MSPLTFKQILPSSTPAIGQHAQYLSECKYTTFFYYVVFFGYFCILFMMSSAVLKRVSVMLCSMLLLSASWGQTYVTKSGSTVSPAPGFRHPFPPLPKIPPPILQDFMLLCPPPILLHSSPTSFNGNGCKDFKHTSSALPSHTKTAFETL